MKIALCPQRMWENAYLTETGLNETVRRHRKAFGEMHVILAFQHLATWQPSVTRYMNAQACGQLEFVNNELTIERLLLPSIIIIINDFVIFTFANVTDFV